MPIIRYFLFAASFVVALLYALDRYLPPAEARSAAPDVDRSIIRIRSARAVPEKIVFDTTSRIAASVSSPLLASETPDRPVRDALAMAEPARPEALARPEAKVARGLPPGATRGSHARWSRAPHFAPHRRLDTHPAVARAF